MDCAKSMEAVDDVILQDVGRVRRVKVCVENMEVGNHVPFKDVCEDHNAKGFVIRYVLIFIYYIKEINIDGVFCSMEE